MRYDIKLVDQEKKGTVAESLIINYYSTTLPNIGEHIFLLDERFFLIKRKLLTMTDESKIVLIGEIVEDF